MATIKIAWGVDLILHELTTEQLKKIRAMINAVLATRRHDEKVKYRVK